MATTAEYCLGEFTFPRGWFMVAEASELENGPIAVRFFANDFVIYRGQSGKVVMLDAYCPHMGTHLCKNTSSYIVRDGTQIHGDSIRCPRAKKVRRSADGTERRIATLSAALLR